MPNEDAEKKRHMNSKSVGILRPHLRGTYVVQEQVSTWSIFLIVLKESQQILHKSAVSAIAPSPNKFQKVSSPTPRGRVAGKMMKKSKVEVGYSESGSEARIALRNFLEKFLEDGCYTSILLSFCPHCRLYQCN